MGAEDPGQPDATRRRLVIAIAAAGALLPALAPLIFIYKYGVNVPFWDQWNPNIAGLFIKVHEGTLRFADLVAQHNEHRILVPRLIFLVLGFLTGWNVFAEMIAGWVMAVITSIAVLYISMKTFGGFTHERESRLPTLKLLLLWLLANALIFCTAQVENWLWGMGMVNFLPMLFIATGIAVCCSALRFRAKVILLTIFNLAATYSAGAGILAWPLTIGLLAAMSWKDLMQRRWDVFALLLAFVIAVGLYFIGYQKPPLPDGQASTASFSDVVHYFCAFLGSTYAYGRPAEAESWGVALGTILLVLWLATVGYFIWLGARRAKPDLRRRMLPWIAVSAFSLLSAALAAKNRSELGVEQALSSRYVTFALYMPLSLIYLAHLIADDVKAASMIKTVSGTVSSWKQTPTLFLLATIVLDLALLTALLMTWPFHQNAAYHNGMLPRVRGKAAMLLTKVLQDDDFMKIFLYPDPPLARKEVVALSEIGFLSPPLVASSDANVMSVSGAESGMKGKLSNVAKLAPETFGFRGWAYGERRDAPAGCVLLTYETESHQSIIFAAANKLGLYRDDEADKIDPKYLRSGWVASVPSAQFPADQKTLVIAAWAFDADTGKATRLDGVVQLKR